MPYRWTDTETVQNYIDSQATIKIGDIAADPPTGNYSEVAVQFFERDSVFEIETLLSSAWIVPLPDSHENEDLQRMAAKLTAAKVGASRIGSTIGGMPDWTQRYKNEVFAQLFRMLLNHETVEIPVGTDTNLTKRENVDFNLILTLAKTRETMVIHNI